MSDFDNRFPITRRGVFMLSVGSLALLAGGRVAQALTPAEQYVAGIGSEVIRLANSDAAKPAMRKRFSSLVNRYANVRSVGLLALGTYQQQLPAGQRDEFFRLVSGYIAAFFVYYLDDFRGTSFDIDSSAAQGKTTIVESRITFDGRRDAKVSWRVTGGRVSDVKVKGIWLSLQLKKRFTDILKRTKGDFEALFSELRSVEGW
jgi:ABC-type transporter MlaC component